MKVEKLSDRVLKLLAKKPLRAKEIAHILGNVSTTQVQGAFGQLIYAGKIERLEEEPGRVRIVCPAGQNAV